MEKFRDEIWRTGPKLSGRFFAGGMDLVIVKVSGKEYVGEYDPEASDGYRPGEFGPGTAVPVRFHGDKCSSSVPRQNPQDHHRPQTE
jgi:hypothetical protein